MTLAELDRDLGAAGVTLTVDTAAGAVHYKAATGALPAPLRAAILEHKAAILARAVGAVGPFDVGEVAAADAYRAGLAHTAIADLDARALAMATAEGWPLPEARVAVALADRARAATKQGAQ